MHRAIRYPGALMLTALIALAGALTTAQAERYWLYSTGEVIPESEHQGYKAVDFDFPDETFPSNGVTFRIVYFDGPGSGFNDNSLGAARKARWKDALAYAASVLGETGTVNIQVNTSQNVNSNLLASCGTSYSIDNIGCTTPQIQGGAFIERLQGDIGLDNVTPHASLTVNFFHNYNLTTNPPAGDQIDFITLLLHELTHALGIASVMTNGTASFTQFPCDTFTTWDALVNRGAGNFPLVGSAPVEYQGVLADLTGNDLVFAGAEATASFGSQPPIFAPGTFLLGSSIGHWDSGLIVGGAVMEPSLSPGEVLRQYRNFELGALKDIGWDNVVVPGGGADTTPPVITRLGAATVSHECGDSFTDPGATATDDVDGNITGSIVVGGDTINSNTAPGTYQITYNVMDSSGNAATQVTRTVNVVDTTEPFLAVVGGPLTLDCGSTIVDPGATANDDCEGGVAVTADDSGVDLTTAGTYQITYTATDGAGNTAVAARTVTVTGPTCVTPPPTGCACADPAKEFEEVDASVFFGDAAAIGLMLSVLVAARRRKF